MTKHPDIAKVSFTGSTATGKKVMESVSSTLKRLTLELGGNDAAIVLDDVDVKIVAPKIFDAAMANSGQICLATKRVYAHKSIYDQLCDELARLAGEVIVDDGLKQGTTMGPIQNKMQFDKVKGFLDDARADGKVIAGGQALERDGYFIAPTIVRDIGDDSRLVREEQFGPVLPILSYDEVDDAIARTNDTTYGLGGSVWTSDIERGFAVASKIDSGTVWVKQVSRPSFRCAVPRRKELRHRRRERPGRHRGIHPGQDHQRRAVGHGAGQRARSHRSDVLDARDVAGARAHVRGGEPRRRGGRGRECRKDRPARPLRSRRWKRWAWTGSGTRTSCVSAPRH